MGNHCNCVSCNNCIICAFKQISAYDLFDNVCCSSYQQFPFLSCAKGTCAEMYCGVGKFARLMKNCDGCHNLSAIPNDVISYKYIETSKEYGKYQSWIAKKTMYYYDFNDLFLMNCVNMFVIC